MQIINYYSNEIVDFKKTKNKYDDIVQEPVFEIQAKQYKCKDEEFEYWLNVIQKTYGQYGKINSESIEDEKTKEEIQVETIKILVQQMTQEKLKSIKNNNTITELTKELADAKLDIIKLKGSV